MGVVRRRRPRRADAACVGGRRDRRQLAPSGGL